MKAMTLNLKEFGMSFSELKDELFKSRRLLLLLILFISGMITGALIYKNSSTDFYKLINDKFISLLDFNYSKVITILLISSLIPLVISFINGFSAVGMPIIMAIPTFCGIAISMIISYIYITYKTDGVIFTLLLIFPATVINILMLFIVCNEALTLSGAVSQNVFIKVKEGRGEPKLFFIRCAVALLISITVCLIQSFAISAIGKNLIF